MEGFAVESYQFRNLVCILIVSPIGLHLNGRRGLCYPVGRDNWGKVPGGPPWGSQPGKVRALGFRLGIRLGFGMRGFVIWSTNPWQVRIVRKFPGCVVGHLLKSVFRKAVRELGFWSAARGRRFPQCLKSGLLPGAAALATISWAFTSRPSSAEESGDLLGCIFKANV